MTKCSCRCCYVATCLALPNRIDDCERTVNPVYLISSLGAFKHRHERHPIQEVHPIQFQVHPTLKYIVYGLRSGPLRGERRGDVMPGSDLARITEKPRAKNRKYRIGEP